MITFRILGPLEALDDGQPLDLGSPQQRALLAVLLLTPNQTVSSDALIEALWSSQPPPSAPKALQIYVSRLRRVLGKPRLETKPPGYLLRVAPDEFDLYSFERHRSEGRFDEALALWKGPPLADIAYRQFARQEVVRLDELRLSCLEERIERDLDQGHAAQLVGELEVLIADHPFREGFCCQLMLAFYRSGRQAEALEAYQRTRRVLVDELGIEPGRRMRELHHRILTQDPALDMDGVGHHARAAVVALPKHGDPPSVQLRGGRGAGVVTFLTAAVDIPSGLWDGDHEAVIGKLVRFDELISGDVERYGGLLLEPMSESRPGTWVFESAAAAVQAAIEGSKVIAGLEWPGGAPVQTRFALHSGEAEAHAGVYNGTTVAMSARISREANAGEVLLSEATAALTGEMLPPGYTVVPLGRFKLQGVARPEQIAALVGPGLTTATGAGECPYRGLLSYRPEDRHLFFGREHVVSEVLARIASGRLLAVVGASGSGKTSLLRAGVLAAAEAGELACVRSARMITPGPEPPLDLGTDPGELLIIDQFKELYTQCRDPELRKRFIEALLARRGPVVIGVRADVYGELGADAALASAVAANHVLLTPMVEDELRRAIVEPAHIAGLRLEPGLVDVVLGDVAGEPGALPLMSHALRETWERRDGRTLSVEAYHATGGASGAVAQTAEAVADEVSYPDRPLLRNLFLRLTEIGDDHEETRRRVPIEELIPSHGSEQAVRNLLERLVDARLVILDQGTAELAHEVLIRRWPRLRRWIEEDREGIRLHRRLSDAARLWDGSDRDPADLYRGARLEAAVEWCRKNQGLLNGPERDFLEASVDESTRAQRAQLTANRRLRRALVGGAILLAATAGLLVWALVQRSAAIHSSKVGSSLALSSEATSLVDTNLASSLLLGLAAYHTDPTPQARTVVTLGLQRAESSGVEAILRSCGEVNSVAFGGPGQRALAVGCYDGNTVLWTTSGRSQPSAPLTLPRSNSCNRVRGLAFSPSGATLAAGCDNGYALLWTIAPGRPVGPPVALPAQRSCQGANGVALGQRTLAVACVTGETVLWDVSLGKPEGGPSIFPGGTRCDIANAAAFGPAGASLAVGCNNGKTVIWPIAGNKPHGAPVILSLSGSCDTVNALAFRGAKVVVGCNNGNAVLWNVARRESMVVEGGSSCDAVGGIAVSAKTLAAGCANGNTVLWPIATGKPLGKPLVVPGSSDCDVVDGVAIGAGTVAVGCADGNTVLLGGTVARPTHVMPIMLRGGATCDSVEAAAATGSQRLAVACNNGNATIWDVAWDGPLDVPITLPKGSGCTQALSAAFDPARRILAIGCAGDTVLWNVASGRPSRPVDLHVGPGCPKSLAVAFDSDNDTVAVGCNNGNAVLWRISPNLQPRRRQILRTAGICATGYGVAFSGSGDTLAVGCVNGNTLLWAMAHDKPVGAPTILPPGTSCDAVYGVAFASGGNTLAVGCYNGNTVLWTIVAGRSRGSSTTLPSGNACDPLLGVAFSPNGGTLAASCYSGNAELWELKGGRPRAGPITLTADGRCAKVYGVAFASQSTLALGCSDGNTLLWNVVPWAMSYGSVQSRVCSYVWGNLSPSEWSTLVPGLPFQAPCAGSRSLS